VYFTEGLETEKLRRYNMRKTSIILVAAICIIAMSGCEAQKVRKTGFLSDYSKLQKESDSGLRYINKETAPKYSAFIVDPVQIRFVPEAKSESKLT
jgi:hypothetical protein